MRDEALWGKYGRVLAEVDPDRPMDVIGNFDGTHKNWLRPNRQTLAKSSEFHVFRPADAPLARPLRPGRSHFVNGTHDSSIPDS